MSATASLPQDVAAYLEDVREALADLPADERDELMADVEASLLEAAADSSAPLRDRLGPPQRFASELRTAAGLGSAPVPAGGEPWGERLKRAARAVPGRVRVLAPMWWVARGYVAVAGLALLLGADWSIRLAALPRLFYGPAGLALNVLVLLMAVALSVAIGGRFGRRGLVVDALLVAAAIPVVVHVSHPPRFDSGVYLYVQYDSPRPVAHFGRQVDNLYAYDRRGRLLQDVRIFDSFGRPMSIGARRRSADPDRRVVRTTTGKAVRNAFPIRYYEPGTRRVRRPEAGPRIDVPALATPPLPRR